MAKDYSDATAALIERQCRNVERKSFVLQKEEATERLLKTYDLFRLERPKKVVWYVDITSKEFQQWSSARSTIYRFIPEMAWATRTAKEARLIIGSTSSATSSANATTWSMADCWAARSAWFASSARANCEARQLVLSPGFVSPLRSTLDYDFDYYILEFEYCQNPDPDYPPKANDYLYLDYCELLMQAKEYGAGYWIEWENTLYIAPTPLVLLDKQNRFHSEIAPAIRWQGGHEFYLLKGENFDKPLWQKIVDQTITAEEVMQIPNVDKREVAYSMLGAQEMLKGLEAKLIHTGIKGNRLYECPNFRDSGTTEYALVMTDTSTQREIIKFVPPEIGKQGNADFATAEGFKDGQGNSLPLDDYLLIEQEA